MATNLPSDATNTNCDNLSDDPKEALLVDLHDAINNINELKDALGNLAQYNFGCGFSTKSEPLNTPDVLRLSYNVINKSSSYTVIEDDRSKFIVVDGQSPPVIIHLTSAAVLETGFFIYIRNIGNYPVIISPDNGELINGLSEYELLPNDSGMIVSTGSAFFIVGNQIISDISINQLSNVDTSMSPTDGQVLRWNAGNARWESGDSSGGIRQIKSDINEIGKFVDPTSAYITVASINIDVLDNSKILISFTSRFSITPIGVISYITYRVVRDSVTVPNGFLFEDHLSGQTVRTINVIDDGFNAGNYTYNIEAMVHSGAPSGVGIREIAFIIQEVVT